MKTLMKNRYPHEAEFLVPPGEILQETIDALGMSQIDLAMRTGLNKKTINQIIQGRERVSHDTALRLERVTGVPARFWNNLEAKYRELLTREAEEERLAQDLDWLKDIPAKELIERGAVAPSEGVTLLEAVLAFFGVNSPKEWEAVWLSPQAAFRKSAAFTSHPGAMATWLRLGELKGQQVQCRPFNKEKFKEALERIRSLTVETPEVFVPKMVKLCAAAGVAVVFVPEIHGAPVSGAAQWLSAGKALIQLTLRHKTNDHFWFTFFHEAGHILKHGKKDKFVDVDGHEEERSRDIKEEEAHEFATNCLIPADRASQLPQLRNRQQIVAFAESIGIAPGIVLGRLQKLGCQDYQNFNNNLKKRFKWAKNSATEVRVVSA